MALALPALLYQPAMRLFSKFPYLIPNRLMAAQTSFLVVPVFCKYLQRFTPRLQTGLMRQDNVIERTA